MPPVSVNTALSSPHTADVRELATITCCPRCHAALQPGADLWHCTAPDCDYAQVGFPVVQGQPVLVDFDRSIFLRTNYERGSGSVLARDDSGRGLRTRLRLAAMGHNPVAARICETMLRLARERTPVPLVLVMGGGAVGSGVAELYADQRVRLIGTDVYASANTRLVADGHALPFRDGVFDAVLIQAVLEHVLEPQCVVDEIHRVLHPDGLVYADTPFMQQVHEAAYDFTRFTRSGHRWLFRRFAEIESGTVGGAGAALLWSIRYYVRALGASNQLATLATMPFIWLRFLERFARPRPNADAASGNYFLGRRAEAQTLRETDMLAYYEGQSEPVKPRREQPAPVRQP
jgi:SAM-dependent methyltransferase